MRIKVKSSCYQVYRKLTYYFFIIKFLLSVEELKKKESLSRKIYENESLCKENSVI